MNDDDDPGPSGSIFDGIMEASCLDDWGNIDGIVDRILGIFGTWHNCRMSDNHVGCSSNICSIKMAGKKASPKR